jgi:endonuclease YncB( thermonuclease family)
MKAKRQRVFLATLGVVWLVSGVLLAGDGVMTGKCVKVIDGDTLIIECEKNRRTVELAEVDAPELDQPWGKEVRNFVRDMVRGREVQIDVVEKTDDVVRVRITVDGYDLSEMLASRGLAWAAEDAADTELAALCAKAKEIPCGLWMDVDPEPPWEFRETRS